MRHLSITEQAAIDNVQLTDAERQQLTTIVTEMVATPEWAATVARNQWQESFLTGEEFEVFIIEEQQSIADLLKELGLA